MVTLEKRFPLNGRPQHSQKDVDQTMSSNDQEFGIWPPYEAFYIEAMLSNTRSAVASIERISHAVDRLSQDSTGHAFQMLDRRGLLDELQNIVLQSAALSRYFWPVRKGHDARGQQLRAALDVANDNPLRNRDLRNEIEHFDEKLDAYLANGITGQILPEYVGVIEQGDGVPVHMFRAYYLDAGLFEMLGRRYSIEPLADEILRLHDRLMICSHTGRLEFRG